MATVENLKIANSGFEFSCEFKNFPVTFVNALRRIVLGSIPTVAIRDVQILENTSQMPHEMLKHRVEMLPVNVNPNDSSTIRDANISLHVLPSKDARIVTTDDFVMESGRENILMKDRDFNTPSIFLRLRPNETVRIKARLALDTVGVSQVCVATTGWHIDPELAKIERKKYEESGKDIREFDNFHVQRCWSRDSNGRPNWIDMKIESIGVLKAREIMGMAIKILRKTLDDFMSYSLEHIQREQDEGSYTLLSEIGGNTIGYLVQEVMYSDQNVNFVAFDPLHPLKDTKAIRFNTAKTPESVMKSAKNTIEEYCSLVEKVL